VLVNERGVGRSGEGPALVGGGGAGQSTWLEMRTQF